MNKLKKLIISIILITILLSTVALFGKEVLAIVSQEMEGGNWTVHDTFQHYTLTDLYNEFDLFCSQHNKLAYIEGQDKLYYRANGINLEYIAQGLPIEFINLGTYESGPDLLSYTLANTLIGDATSYFNNVGGEQNKNKKNEDTGLIRSICNPKYVRVNDEQEATPMEAYVLSEMTENVVEGVRIMNIYDKTAALLQPPVTIDPDDITSEFNMTDKTGGIIDTIYLIEHKNDDGIIDSIEYFIKEGSQFYKISTNSGVATEAYGVLSYVQQAWWQTPAGSHGETTPPNELSEEAYAFQLYILQAAKKSSVPELEYEYVGTVEGNPINLKAPVLQYEPKWEEDSHKDPLGEENEEDKVTIGWDADKQTYKVGPFSIDYIDARKTTNVGDVAKEYTAIFAQIYDSVLETNKGNLQRVDPKIVDGKLVDVDIQPGEYRFIFDNVESRPTHERDGNVNFPMPNEEFYLEIGYMEGLTEIKNLEFKFEYMNAAARYQDMVGTATYQQWAVVPHINYYGECFDSDCLLMHYPGKTHYRKVELKAECVSCNTSWEIQRMAHGTRAERWYNHTELKLAQYVPNHGSLIIEKKVVDEEGKELIVTEDTNFEFKVDITKQDLEGNTITDSRSVVVTVKKGESSGKQIVATEEWGKFNKKQYSSEEEDIVEVMCPTYTITELPTKGYKPYEPITNAGGSFIKDKEIIAVATNEMEKKKGSLQINKVISEDLAVETDESAEVAKKYLEEKVYYFNIYINEELKYKKVEISKDTDWKYVMPEESWDGESPTYRVEEVNSEGEVISEKDNIEVKYNAQTGKLEDGETVVVTATNTAIRHKGTLKISKILKNTADTEINDTEFKFKVKVEGYEEKEITVKSGSVWAQEYYWVGDTAPKYTITEIIEDENRYKLVNITDNLKGKANIEDKTIEGELKKDTEVIVTAENTDKILQGKLQITKKILDRNGNALVSDKNQEFNFTINVKYSSSDGSKTNSEQRKVNVKVESGKSIATSEELVFEWDSDTYNNTPEYEITEELDTSSEYAVTFSGDGETPEGTNTRKGNLDSAKKIEVTANNKLKDLKTGKIKIIKELVDEFGNPVAAETDMTFEFVINVKNGDKLQTKSGIKVKVKAGESESEVSEHVFSWIDDGNPENDTYEVIEVIPELSNYKIYKIENQTGKLGNDTVVVTAKNAKELEQGKIRITKQLIDESGKKLIAEKDTVFSFDVEITNKDLTKTKEQVSVVVKKGESQATSQELSYTWKEGDYLSEDGPSYEIKEANVNGDYIQESITPSSGKLTKNTVINVVATNRKIGEYEGKLKLVKEVKYDKDGTGTLENAILKEDAVFKFNIQITKAGEVTPENYVVEVPVKAGTSAGETEFTYKWKGSTAPTYIITEDLHNDYNFHEIKSDGEGGDSVTGSFKANNTINIIATNQSKKLKGKLRIVKKVDHEDLKDTKFEFEIYKDGIKEDGTVELKIEKTDEGKEYSAAIEKEYTWFSHENAPKITIKEISLPANSKLLGYINNGAELIPNAIDAEETDVVKTIITAVNTINQRKGQIQIAKDLAGGVNGIEFKFRVQVDGYAEKIVTVKSGETWRSDYYYWTTEKNPKYTVTEVDSDSYEFLGISATDGEVSGKSVSGELKESTIIAVEAKNGATAKNGKIKITKELRTDDKTDVTNVEDKFEFAITIFYDDPTKLFTYNGKEYNSLTISETIKGAGSVTTSNITWYDNEAPRYSIKEVNTPNNWRFLQFIDNPDKPYGTLKESQISVKCVNEQFIDRRYYFTMEMGGKVWNDTVFQSGKPVDTASNGKIDDNEEGFADIKVTIYKIIKRKSDGKIVKRDIAGSIIDTYGTSYDKAVLYTDANGIWRIKEMAIPGLTEAERLIYPKESYVSGYDVEFEYDAQTYEPTKLLTSGSVSDYKSCSTTRRDDYLKDSMVIDDEQERKDFNKKFEVVSGKEPIDGNGNTIGSVSEGIINYSSKDVQGIVEKNKDGLENTRNSLNTKKVSTVNLYDDSDKLYDIYKLSSRTSTGGLVYPLDSQTVLQSTDRNIMDYGTELGGVVTVTYQYHAAYPYLNSINFGLIEREHADIAIEKDLEEAIVVVNKKAYKYTYDELANREFAKYPDLLYKQIETNDMDVKYRLNVYSTDYYYKAAIYDKAEVEKPDGTKANLYALLDEYYKSLSLNGVVDTELDIYVKYKTTIINESDSYNVIVNQISDYYDSEMELVTTEVKKYIEENNGHTVNDTTLIATPSYIAGTGEKVEWSEAVNAGKDSSTGKTYNRMTTESLKGIELKSGETQTIYTTFRIKKNQPAEMTETGEIILGTKHNIVEIDSYSTYYSENADTIPPEERIAGRIEEDSAPGNINLKEYNEPTWYEDDTSAAPVLTIDLYDIRREINGLVWEDKESQEIQYYQKVGDGKYNEPEEEDTIPYMTTKLYEKVTVPFEEVQDDGTSKTVYYDYDFLWPTDVAIPGLDGTIEELTGFDSTIRTNDLGQYKFEGISSGNYIVRFIYGDESTLQYSGQDYKSTAYQPGYEYMYGEEKRTNDKNGDGLLDNEWHNLDDESLVTNRVSDARDDEIRRLDVIAKSQTLTYDNTSILARARDGLKDYYMFADTAKINMKLEKFINDEDDLEDPAVTIKEQRGIIETTSGTVGSINITYIIDNIDFGIEERSQTNVVLDKQIKEIKLTTSAGDLILDAKFSIDYDIDGFNIKPKVELDSTSIGTENLQKLNNTATLQGFRYINIDKDILQGATIQVTYQFTVLNTGEVDRCAKDLTDLGKLVDNADFADVKKTLKDNNAKWDTCEYGKYLGKVYYSGEHAMDATGKCDDEIVTTTIHKVIDYVDNDVVFSSVDNMGVDSSWANTTTDYLTTGNLIDESIISTETIGGTTVEQILDEYGRAFESAHKNNLIVNVDNDDTAQPQLTNPGFVTELVPNNVYKYKDDKSESDAENFKDAAKASMTLTVSRYYSSESDTENIDNLSEIIEMYNDVGRRDVGTIQGNAKPSEGPFKTSIKETDSSATELITLSPPTGISSKIIFTIQLLSVILSAVTILVIGIIAIKKKVLTK